MLNFGVIPLMKRAASWPQSYSIIQVLSNQEGLYTGILSVHFCQHYLLMQISTATDQALMLF